MRPPEDMPKPQRKSAWIHYFFIGAFVLILISLASLPTFLSSDLGNHLLVNFLQKKIPGQLRVEKIHLSWFQPIQAKDILIENEPNQILRIHSLTSSETLLQWLLHFYQPHLLKAQGIIFQENQEPLPFKLESDEINMLLQFVGLHLQKIDLQGKGETLFDHLSGSFEANVQIPLRDILNTTGEITLNQFPTQILERLAQVFRIKTWRAGLLERALGKNIDLKMTKQDLNTNIQIRSEHLRSSIEVQLKDHQIRVKGGSFLNLELPSSFFNHLHQLFPVISPDQTAHLEALLLNPHTLEISSDQISFIHGEVLKKPKIQLYFDPERDEIKVSSFLNLVKGEKSSNLLFQTTLSKKKEWEIGELLIKGEDFPLDIFENSALAFKGKTLNFEMISKNSMIQLEGSAENLQFGPIKFIQGDEISLIHPFQIKKEGLEVFIQELSFPNFIKNWNFPHPQDIHLFCHSSYTSSDSPNSRLEMALDGRSGLSSSKLFIKGEISSIFSFQGETRLTMNPQFEASLNPIILESSSPLPFKCELNVESLIPLSGRAALSPLNYGGLEISHLMIPWKLDFHNKKLSIQGSSSIMNPYQKSFLATIEGELNSSFGGNLDIHLKNLTQSHGFPYDLQQFDIILSTTNLQKSLQFETHIQGDGPREEAPLF